MTNLTNIIKENKVISHSLCSQGSIVNMILPITSETGFIFVTSGTELVHL